MKRTRLFSSIDGKSKWAHQFDCDVCSNGVTVLSDDEHESEPAGWLDVFNETELRMAHVCPTCRDFKA